MRQTTLRLTLAALVLGGCSRPDTKEDAATPPAPQTVTFSSADYSYTGPDTIAAGMTTFRLANIGKEAHHMFLVRLDQGKTMQDFQQAMAGGEHSLPAWAVMVGGPNAAEPGDTLSATMAVDSGNYVFFCVIPSPDGQPHVAKGMMRGLTVVPATGPAAPAPTAGLTLTLVDYGFEWSTPITPGTHTIEIRNTAGQPHELVMVRLDSAATIQDWLRAAEKMDGPLPGKLVEGIAGLSPGQVAYITHDFTPGKYGFVCFVPDSKDGKPHFLHGMVNEVAVS